ncbi:MAG: phosphatidate cytidylyltransferase [Hyphomicrobiaceae bacterium]|nr:phosphatidate cytidylyltransferase [Hyphomicrobiaceae bacterium]MDX2450234.1 phosphatidate cytidylyltransferase [Hyphomicrobiaceae bacterium]
MTSSETPPGSDPKNAEAPQIPEILIRSGSAFILAAVAFGAVITDLWTFVALVVVAGGLLTWEWGGLTRGSGFDGTSLIATVCVTAVAILVAMGRPDLALIILGGTAAAIAFAGASPRHGAWALAGLAYVVFPAWALVWLRSDSNLGVAAILFVLAVVWTTDTASYIGGRGLGGAKLAPRISPNKTWSGFFVGVLTPGLIGYGFGLALHETTPWCLAGVSIALALACQLGDLLESGIKRHYGVKDMSQLIPGHGGLFDRVDGLLPAAVVAGLIGLRNIAEPGAGLLIW